MHTKTLFIIAFVFSLSTPFFADAQTSWWDTNWQYRKRIVIDGTKVDASLSDFPVLVKLTSANFDFSKPQGNGNDLRFIDHSGASPLILAYEIERHATSTQQAEIWVKIPSVQSGADTSFYLYYGNASAPAGQNSTQVWDTNYAGVWHMKEDPSGTAPQIKDSTSNGNNGTTAGAMTSTQQVAGQVDGSLSLDGADDLVAAGGANINFGQSSFSAFAWVKSSDTDGSQSRILGKDFNNPGPGGWAWLNFGNGIPWLEARDTEGVLANITNWQVNVSGINVADNQWHQVGFVIDRAQSQSRIYVDGLLRGTKNVTSSGIFGDGTATKNLNIGSQSITSPLDLAGQIDEVRVSKTARTSAEIKVFYHSENDTLLAYKLEETPSAPAFDFSLTQSGNISVSQDASASNAVTATLFSGISQPVSFSISGLPSGAAASFSSSSCIPACSTTLTITTDTPVPGGVYIIMITASGGGLTQTTNFTLTVTGLVTHWKFDEGSGASVSDSADGHVGILKNMDSINNWVDGQTGSGNALYFDGADDFVDVNHNLSIDPEKITVSAWFNPTALKTSGDTRDWLVNKNSNEWAEGHYALILDGNAGRAGAYLNIGGGSGNVYVVWSVSNEIETNKWYLATLTYDGSELKFYLNGESASSTPINKPRVNGFGSLVIGKRADNYAKFKGVIDEVRLYNRSLSATEILALYKIGPPPTPPTQPAGLTAISVSPYQINLSWNTSTDDVGVSGYKIYRDGAQIAVSTTTTYSDPTLSPATSYTYTVAAYDAKGNTSSPSAGVNAVTLSAPVQQIYYVSPTGDNNNPGTITRPFKTIEKARDTVRTINTNMTGDIIVYLRGGEYELASTLLFDKQDSGTNGYHVIYRAYPEERPFVSGGQKITGWVPAGNGVYKALVGSLRFRQLYVNGNRAIRARTPNEGSYYRVVSWDETNKFVVINQNEITNWPRLNEIEIITQHHWTQSNLRIASFTTSGGNTYITPSEPERTRLFAQTPPHRENNQPYHFENAYEFLDSPGEFYLNTTTNELFYKPRQGEDMTNAVVVAPKLETLIKIQGTLDTRARNIQFYGITFEYATWTLPNAEGFVGNQTVAYKSTNLARFSIPGAIHFENTESIRFERNIVQHTGGSGIILYSGTLKNVIIGNVVTDISGTGIGVNMVFIANPLDPRKITKGDIVSNNYVTKIGKDYYGSVGIYGGYTDSLVVEHNEIFDVLYGGIHVGWGWTLSDTALKNNLIRYNNIYNVHTLLDDSGGIYTLSKQPGTQIFENYVHDIVRSSWAGSFVIAGLRLDQGSDFITVQNNVWQNVPKKLSLNRTRAGVNNFVINNTSNIDGSLQFVIDNAGLEQRYRDIKLAFSSLQLTPQPSQTAQTIKGAISSGGGGILTPSLSTQTTTPATTTAQGESLSIPKAIRSLAFFRFAKPLAFGLRSDDVRKLQEFFAEDKEIYPEGLVTGYFGPLTQQAAQRFQKKYGIVSSGTPATTGYGQVGPKTLAKLNELLARSSPESLAEIPTPPPLPPEERAKRIEEIRAEIEMLRHQLLELIQKFINELRVKIETIKMAQ